jgi:hypothetical protein
MHGFLLAIGICLCPTVNPSASHRALLKTQPGGDTLAAQSGLALFAGKAVLCAPVKWDVDTA